MSMEDVINVAKKHYPEPVNSKIISEETGISRGVIAYSIRRMKSRPNLYDEVHIYEGTRGSGKKEVNVIYLKHNPIDYFKEIKQNITGETIKLKGGKFVRGTGMSYNALALRKQLGDTK